MLKTGKSHGQPSTSLNLAIDSISSNPSTMKALNEIMRKLFNILWILTITSYIFENATSFVQTSQQPKPYKTQVVSGLYQKDIPVKFYQTVVPLVFEFEVPEWEKSETIVPRSQNCTSTNFTASSTCPVLFYLPEIQERFSNYLSESEPFVKTLPENIAPSTTEIQFDCDRITTHFSYLFTDKETIESYLERLQRCATREFSYIRQIPNYNYNISDIYMKMRQGFYNEFWLKVNDGRIDAALWANAINTFNSLIYSNFLMESNRWKMAVIECKQQRIPQTLISSSLLSDTLNDLEEKIAKKNYVLTVPLRLTQEYYSLPLTDCTFTNSTFLVRILVPVLEDHQYFSLTEIIPASFYYKKPTENKSKNESYMCSVTGINDVPLPRILMVDRNNNLVFDPVDHQCNSPGSICHFPSLVNRPKVNPCASALIALDLQNIVRYCSLSCETLTAYHLLPVMSKVGFNKFVFTGPSGPTPVIRCPSSADTIIRPVDIGAVEITLPCNCRLMYHSVTFEGDIDFQCWENTPLVVNQIFPLHWVGTNNLTTLSLNSNGHDGQDATLSTNNLIIRVPLPHAGLPDTSKFHDNSSAFGVVQVISIISAAVVFLVLIGVLIRVYYKHKTARGGFSFSKHSSSVTYVGANGPLLDEQEVPASEDRYNVNL